MPKKAAEQEWNGKKIKVGSGCQLATPSRISSAIQRLNAIFFLQRMPTNAAFCEFWIMKHERITDHVNYLRWKKDL